MWKIVLFVKFVWWKIYEFWDFPNISIVFVAMVEFQKIEVTFICLRLRNHYRFWQIYVSAQQNKYLKKKQSAVFEIIKYVIHNF